MTADCNGWNDMPEDEREALDAENDKAWRGELHPDESEEEWPEDQAGCEYWLYKGLNRDEDKGK